MLNFTHLHVHSHYSTQDGMATIDGLVDKAISEGMNAIALTDHGNMFGIKEFFDYCTNKKNKKSLDEIEQLKKQLKKAETTEEKQDIEQQMAEVKNRMFKPILGCEAYVSRRSRFDKETKEDGYGYHLILLAKNKKGYQNLCKLISAGWVEGFYYKPRIDKDILAECCEGLIVASACLGGEINKKLEENDYEGAKAAALWYKNVFGDDYYIELQRLETNLPDADQSVYEKQKVQNILLVKIARELNIKLIATNDVHFIEKDHAEAHDRLICLATGKKVDDKDRMRYTKQEWLKSKAEMESIFSDIPEALENTQEIVDKVEHYSLNSPPIMPRFEIPEDFGTEDLYREKFSHEDLEKEFGTNEKGESRIEGMGGFDRAYRIKLEIDYLRKITMEGALRRYGENLNEELKERIDFELSVIRNMGYPGYFLIVEDFIRQARAMEVLVGPGRGSAAGSVVSYCLGITNIDPLKYGLLFERFLNPDRISLPDIDIDFDDKGRGKVLNWVTEKYGKERVAHIITYGTMAAKSSIKDVARVQDLPLSISNQLVKEIPDKIPDVDKITLQAAINYNPRLQEACQSADLNIANTMKYALQLEGTVRQTGVHACGVIIGAEDLVNFVPLSVSKDRKTEEDILITQYEGGSIESVGLIKMDFLGLKDLSIVKEALSNIKKSQGIDIDIDKIPLDDEPTYKLFSSGATVAIFQFESPGMRKYLRELKPTQFEDLIAMNALYRPGPMDYIPNFINRKHGKEKIDYPLPPMEEYLKETYGITVYQEQVMLLSRKLAGFTRGQSDTLRKAMGKKDKVTLEKMKPDFLKGGTENGHDPQILEKIWADWEKFAEYAFNKSHSTCYAMQAYQVAYLKSHYPAEYMAACLTNSFQDITEISKIIADCVRMRIKVLGPSINESDALFAVNKRGEIRFGLTAIKNVGQNAVAEIIAEREKSPYKSILDFVQRVNLTKCNKRCVESLALAGAFDEFEDVHRAQMFVEKDGSIFLEKLLVYAGKYQAAKESMQISMFDDGDTEDEDFMFAFPQCPQWSSMEKLSREKEVTGFYISGHPLDDYKLEIDNFCKGELAEFEDIEYVQKMADRVITIAGMVVSGSYALNKKGEEYMRLVFEDYQSKQRMFYLNGDVRKRFGYLCVAGNLIALSVKPELNYNGNRNKIDDYRFTVTQIEALEEIMKRVKGITIELPNGYIDEEFISGMTALITEYPNPKGIGLKFKILQDGMDLLLSSKEKVDAKQFCKELRLFMPEDTVIGLE